MTQPVAGRAGSVRGVFRELWPYTRGDRSRLVAGGLLSLVLLGCEVASVVIFDTIVSDVLESRHLTGFWLLAGLWLGAAALGAVAMAWGGWLTGLRSASAAGPPARRAASCRPPGPGTW